VVGDQFLSRIRGREFSLHYDILFGSGDHPPSCPGGATVCFQGIKWSGHKADLVPRLRAGLPHIFRMWPLVNHGNSFILRIYWCIISVKITGTEFCSIKFWKKGWKVFITKCCQVSC
jgi:hypothetical protein